MSCWDFFKFRWVLVVMGYKILLDFNRNRKGVDEGNSRFKFWRVVFLDGVYVSYLLLGDFLDRFW